MTLQLHPMRLLGRWEICARYDLTDSQFRRFVSRDDFPKPFQHMRRGRVWHGNDIDEWERRNAGPPNRDEPDRGLQG